MQKVVGSSPIIRSYEAPETGLFVGLTAGPGYPRPRALRRTFSEMAVTHEGSAEVNSGAAVMLLRGEADVPSATPVAGGTIRRAAIGCSGFDDGATRRICSRAVLASVGGPLPLVRSPLALVGTRIPKLGV